MLNRTLWKIQNCPFREKVGFFLTLFLLNGINVFGQLDNQYTYEIPKKLNDGWDVSSLNSVGIDVNLIEDVTQRMIAKESFENVLSLLIVKNGKLVHEAYSPYCQRNTLHWMASITKTVTSTLIGIAIDKGFIENVNARVSDLLPEFADAITDPEFKNIEIEHIMTMSSGLQWLEQVSYNDPRNSEHLMVDTQDWISYVLSRPVQDKPGTRFLYNTGGMHLLSAVIHNTTGLYINQFAEKYLLHPMGIFAYQWNRDPMGYPCTGGTDGGIGLRTRDVAKIGWLFLNNGVWDGKRIISENWLQEAPKKQIKKPYGNNYYGYNWFPGSMTVNTITFDYIASFGYGGQTLYVVPKYDLILVFTCELAEGNANVNILVRDTFKAIIR